MDISVDFSGVDAPGTKGLAQNVSFLLTDMNLKAVKLVNSTRSSINSIESSVGAIQALVNTTAVSAELEEIDDDADEIDAAIENATAGIDDDATAAEAILVSIRSSLDSMNARIESAKAKMDGLRQQRDELLPSIDKVSSDIDSMQANVRSLQATLDEASQRIADVKGRSAESIASPITTKIEPVSTQKTHFNSMFPTLLVLIVMITGILLSSTLVIVEKKSKAFFRNNFTPTSYFLFSISTYITALIVLLIQLLMFVSVSAFFFETEVLTSIWVLLLIVFLMSTVFICIGMLIGFLFRTEETANLAAITLISVFLLFSTAVIPLESLPAYMKSVAMFNPFVISELALRQSLIFQLGFTKLLYGIGILAAYAVGIFLILIVAQDALKRLSFAHFHKNVKAKVMEEKKAQAVIAPEVHAPQNNASDDKPAKNADMPKIGPPLP